MTKKTLLFLVIVFLSLYHLLGQTSKEKLLNSSYQEHYVEFETTNRIEIQDIANKFSIDNLVYLPEKKCYKITVWLHQRDFANFTALEIPFEILYAEQNDAKVSMANSIDELMDGWTRYPTYLTYEALMSYFQNTYPALCKIDTILPATPKGRKILSAHISTTLDGSVPKPKFFYSSTMHGDEAGGYYMMLRLIHYILSNQEDSKVNAILNSVDLWITPLENPDGVYYSGDNTLGTSPVSSRANANGYDLNRNYPKAFTPIGSSYQPEVTAMMNFMNLHQFTMSANLHDGSELFNYVWDLYTTKEMKHPDSDWWENIGRAFADSCHFFAPNYFTDRDNGITSGGNWYVIINSRQDYANYHARCREVTLEVSRRKVPNNNELNTYWNNIKTSLLNYILAIHPGISGIVTDSLTGKPLQARIFINNHDQAHQRSDIYSQLPHGDYYRPLLPKTYSVTYSAKGYYSKTDTVTVFPYKSTIRDVKLLRNEIYNSDNEIIIYPNPVNNQLKIIVSDTWKNATVTLFSITGKQIEQFIICETESYIDVTAYPNALYFIHFSKQGQEKVFKIVVQK